MPPLAGFMTAGRKWLQLIADIVLYESAHTDDGELLSEFCDPWIQRHPVAARGVILTVGAVVVLHLANVTPLQYDVMSRAFWQRTRRA